MLKFNADFTRYLREAAKRRILIRAERKKGKTLEAVGAQFGISRERVRQICNSAA